MNLTQRDIKVVANLEILIANKESDDFDQELDDRLRQETLDLYNPIE